MSFALSHSAQVMSDLLTIREKGVLVHLLEPHCKLLKTTVVQLLQAQDAGGGRLGWTRFDCGVLCLVEDQSVQSYFLRLYSVQHTKLLWEQELYIPFQYTASCRYFHTFPGDSHLIGLNFANEIEAEEFQSAVRTANDRMTVTINAINQPISSSSDTLESGNIEEEALNDQPSVPSESSFADMDPSMRRLLKQAKLTEEDLKNKDVAEVVDCIINRFGGLKAVQKELKKRSTVSQTLPRAAGASISFALQKKPLPPLPSSQNGANSQQTSQEATTRSDGQSAPAPGRLRRSASVKDVGSSEPSERGDLILSALREVFKQKQMLQPTKQESQNGGLP